MTSRQTVYMELCKAGYNLQEIATITERSTNAVLTALKSAVTKPCRSPENCRSCPFEITCTANLQRVQLLTAKRTQAYHIQTHNLPRVDPDGGGRYQY